jgi:phenylacetate-CoA ligase
MIKVKGVNIYPGQIENVLCSVNGLSSEYQIIIEHFDGKDSLTLKVETNEGMDKTVLSRNVQQSFKNKIGIKISCKCVDIGALPRTEKKAKRIFDYRYN